MSEYLIQGSTLTALGDEVRELSGTQNAMSPIVMADKLGEANDEVNSQSTLIEQIATALEGKAAGGSGGGNTVRITVRNITGYGFDANGQPVYCYSGDYDLLEGIIYLHETPTSISGSYVKVPTELLLYKFSTEGVIKYVMSGGGSGSGN